MKTLLAISLGFVFGSVLIFSEAFHWYRIQEMFHFESFHMYGLLGSAIVTGTFSMYLFKRFRVKSVSGNKLIIKKKSRKPVGNIVGGVLFGVGWGLTGACTAPLLILVGLNWQIGAIGLFGALLGTLIFASLKSKLPE